MVFRLLRRDARHQHRKGRRAQRSSPTSTNLAFHVFLALGCTLGIVVRGRRIHEAIGLVFALAIATYIAILFTHLA
ncbi:MAG: hypothetical protein ABIT20_12415 [Gemmatimonadaceae bacterium]